MKSFVDFAEQFMRGSQEDFNALPQMVRDLVSSTLNLRDYAEYKSIKYPILTMSYGTYDCRTVMLGLKYLKTYEVNAFVLAEASTATLGILETIMLVNENKSFGISCSCNECFRMELTNRWGNKDVMHGLLIRMKNKNTNSKVLRGDLIG